MDAILLIAAYLVFFVLPALFVYRLYKLGKIWTALHFINWFAIAIFLEEALLAALGMVAGTLNGDSSIIFILAYASILTLIFPFAAIAIINILYCIVLITRSVFKSSVKPDIFAAMIGFTQRPGEPEEDEELVINDNEE